MNTLIDRINMYLSQAAEGKAEITDDIIKEFGTACRKILIDAFTPREDSTTDHRISAIGRPVCQQWFNAFDPDVRAPIDHVQKMKFLIGDLSEALMVAIIKGAGVVVEAEQEPVTADLGDGVTINGQLDVVIEGKVYDIKTASPYAFTHKFAAADGFSKIIEDDPFGYVAQGYLYAEGKQLPFGGWIALNKSTGQWALCSPPRVDTSYKKAALKQAKDNATAIIEKRPFKRCFEPEEETFYKKKTGNMRLAMTCGYCAYKEACWGDQIVYAANPSSKAKDPTKYWYLGTPK